MQNFYVWEFKKGKRWAVIIAFALFAALFLWFEREGVFSVLSPSEEEVVLSRGNANEANIALTFNISWGEEKVKGILKELENEKVRATFFLSGEWAERHPELVEEIEEGEHEIGMLGYRYKSYLDQEIDEVRNDLLQAKEIFKKLGYEDINLLRTPSGHFNKEIIELTEQLEFQVVQWNVNPDDWKNPGTNVIVNKVMGETSNGDIILMHASDSAKQTAGALETILPGLKNKGFSFVSITELVNQAKADAEIIE